MFLAPIGDACRVLLLYLASHMTDAGRVSVPRARIVAELNIDERRVTARITEATRAGLLSKRGGGYNGRTAEYEALLPNGVKVAAERPPSTVKVAGERPPRNVHLQPGETDLKVDAQRPPIARVPNESRTTNSYGPDAGANCTSNVVELSSGKRAAHSPPAATTSSTSSRQAHTHHQQRHLADLAAACIRRPADSGEPA